jgi:hypothetical protein
MNDPLLAVDKAIEPGDMALFFAGHGLEIHSENFLVPTDIPPVGDGSISRAPGERTIWPVGFRLRCSA